MSKEGSGRSVDPMPALAGTRAMPAYHSTLSRTGVGCRATRPSPVASVASTKSRSKSTKIFDSQGRGMTLTFVHTEYILCFVQSVKYLHYTTLRYGSSSSSASHTSATRSECVILSVSCPSQSSELQLLRNRVWTITKEIRYTRTKKGDREIETTTPPLLFATHTIRLSDCSFCNHQWHLHIRSSHLYHLFHLTHPTPNTRPCPSLVSASPQHCIGRSKKGRRKRIGKRLHCFSRRYHTTTQQWTAQRHPQPTAGSPNSQPSHQTPSPTTATAAPTTNDAPPRHRTATRHRSHYASPSNKMARAFNYRSRTGRRGGVVGRLVEVGFRSRMVLVLVLVAGEDMAGRGV